MAPHFRITRHEPQGYALQLVDYEDLRATVPQRRMEDHSWGIFPDEEHCVAYLRDIIGIPMERITDRLMEVTAVTMGSPVSLPLSVDEARRVLERGDPT